MELGTALVLRVFIPIFVGIVSGAIMGSTIYGQSDAARGSFFMGEDLLMRLALLSGAFLGGIIGGILGLINATTNCSKLTAAVMGGLAGALTALLSHMVSLKSRTHSVTGGAAPIEKHHLVLLLACILAGVLVSLISSWSNRFR